MKILHYEAGKKLFGGAYQVAGLVQRLQGGFEHHVFCAEGSEIGTVVEPFATVHRTPIKSDIDLRTYFALKRVAKKIKPDILHIHSRRGADLWGPIVARQLNIPFILCRRVDNLEAGWLFRFRARKATKVVGISQKIGEVVKSMGVEPSKIEVIRSGVDTGAYQPTPKTGCLKREFGLPQDALLVGMAAQFIPRKGHLDLLAAAPTLLKQHPRCHFILLGNGAQRPRIEQEVTRLGLSSHVVFPGFRKDLPQLLPELDILVHPAHTEGLGVALLQASACALPIVATAAGGIPEIVHDGINGFLVEPKNPAQLGNALSQLLGDEEMRAQFGKAGRKFALEEASLDQTASQTKALYHKIALERPTSPEA